MKKPKSENGKPGALQVTGGIIVIAGLFLYLSVGSLVGFPVLVLGGVINLVGLLQKRQKEKQQK